MLYRVAEETARRQRADFALLQSQKLEAVGRLTGGVAHNFNNVLAVVGGNVELMRRLPPDRPRDAQINAIGPAVSSGKHLTRQLLTFARKQPLLLERVFPQERLLAMPGLLRPLLGSTTQIEIGAHRDTPSVEVVNLNSRSSTWRSTPTTQRRAVAACPSQRAVPGRMISVQTRPGILWSSMSTTPVPG